jgi:fimbrial chaperone protein
VDTSRRARRRSGASPAAVTAPLVFLLSLWLSQGLPASASTFTVDRVQIFLSARTKSDGLTVHNVSAETVRFQLSVFAWDQTAQGEMALASSPDIVFFPQLFALAPGEERHVRIGSATPPAASEKAYRLFIEELPTPGGGSPGGPPGQVTIRTRLGIPIFLRPPTEATAGGLEALSLRDGRVSFAVRNTGTVHFIVQGISITGYGSANDIVVQGALEGWYILAGGTRQYELELPSDKCPAVKVVSLEVRTAQATFTERLEVSPNACSR